MRDWKSEVHAQLQMLAIAPGHEADMVEELAQHLRDRYEEFRAEGQSTEDAEVAVLAELDSGQLIEQLRRTAGPYTAPVVMGASQGTAFTGFLQDLRYAWRVLRATPGFTIVCVISLALGIGANTAMFQLINAVRLRTLPVPHPGQLAILQFKKPHSTNGTGMGRYHEFTYALWKQIAARQQGFSSLAAFATDSWDLSNGGEVHYAHGMYVSGNFFNVLQVPALLGRGLHESDDAYGCSTGPAVISYSFWQRETGADPNVIGQTFTLDRYPFQVIGVMPASFYGVEVGRVFDVAIPLCTEPVMRGEQALTSLPHGWWLAAFGRLKPGWSIKTASAQLSTNSAGIMEATLPPAYRPDIAKNYLAGILEAVSGGHGYSRLREEYETPLALLLAVCGIVLLIACANLANLMLARASVREREIAVRLALGASRARLVRQLLTESLLLAIVGAGAGVGLANLLSRFLVTFLSTQGGRIYLDRTLDFRVLGFTAALAVGTCLLFGLMPSLKATNIAPSRVMNSASRSVTATRERFGMRRVLATVQVAMSLVLLVGALLFVRTLRNLMQVDTGFQRDGILVADADFSNLQLPPASRVPFRQLLLSRVEEQPCIDSAARTGNVPLGGWGDNDQVVINGVQLPGDVNESHVSPGYFRTLSIPLLAGRDFDAGDTATSQRVAIVNEQFARKLLGTSNPISKTFQVAVYQGEPQYTYQIVGVVKNTKQYDLREEIQPMAYYPETQDDKPVAETSILVRSSLPLSTVLPEVKQAVAAVNGGVELEFTSMEEQVKDGLLRERLLAALSGGFALLAGILATVGLYGLIAFIVVRRTNEIGVRMALGAQPAAILKMIVLEATNLLAIGITAGIVVATFAMRAASMLLYGLKPYDPVTFMIAVLVLSAATIAASLIPAARAARVDPNTALREQ